ncbi:MAG: glycosyltransferase family 2 protein, partial [Muribaculaceae bacterium]|nr:glycosyltransferase family 2 protein [Muribaculaceae bacterium]
MKELAVIILNWNGRKLLEQFLPIASRYSITEDADLIVADNGSTDDSVEWVKAHHPEVKVLSFSENYGFAEGYNKAIRQTQYKYTILLNSDVEVTEDWTRSLLDFMRRNSDVGALQPKIRSWKERTKFEYAGAAGGYLDKLGYPYCRGRLFDSIEEDRGQYDGKVVNICWASGAALMVRTDIYLKVGGLDARFFAHMEEIDLCCRIHGAGYRVVAVPDAMVFHVGGASLAQGNPKKTYLNFRNN